MEERLWTYKPHADTSEAAGPEVEVEAILGRRNDKEKNGVYTEYLVKWRGFPLSEATWEPVSKLANASEATRRFDEMIKAGVDPKAIRRTFEEAERRERHEKKKLKRARYGSDAAESGYGLESPPPTPDKSATPSPEKAGNAMTRDRSSPPRAAVRRDFRGILADFNASPSASPAKAAPRMSSPAAASPAGSSTASTATGAAHPAPTASLGSSSSSFFGAREGPVPLFPREVQPSNVATAPSSQQQQQQQQPSAGTAAASASSAPASQQQQQQQQQQPAAAPAAAAAPTAPAAATAGGGVVGKRPAASPAKPFARSALMSPVKTAPAAPAKPANSPLKAPSVRPVMPAAKKILWEDSADFVEISNHPTNPQQPLTARQQEKKEEDKSRVRENMLLLHTDATTLHSSLEDSQLSSSLTSPALPRQQQSTASPTEGATANGTAAAGSGEQESARRPTLMPPAPSLKDQLQQAVLLAASGQQPQHGGGTKRKTPEQHAAGTPGISAEGSSAPAAR